MTTTRRYAVISKLPPDLPLALMDLAIGSAYLLSGQQRSTSAAFRVARALLPMWVWGACFLLVGSLLLGVVITTWARPERRVSHAVWVLRVLGATLFAMWAIMFLLSGIRDQHAALAGVPVYLYLAYRHSFAPAGR
jgi:hypothetical protein